MANTRIDSATGIDKVKPGAVIGGVVNPAAGRVGEILSASTNAAGITNAVPFTAATLSLSAGVWDVSGVIGFAAVNATPTMVSLCVSAANSLDMERISFQLGGIPYSDGAYGPLILPTAMRRIVLPAPATVYLTGMCYFASGTMSITSAGNLTARRAA